MLTGKRRTERKIYCLPYQSNIAHITKEIATDEHNFAALSKISDDRNDIATLSSP